MSLRKRDRLALSIAPLVLRVGLGLIFIWAGLGKFIAERRYTPEQCAILANMGVDVPTGKPAAAADAAPIGRSINPTLSPPNMPIPDSPKGKPSGARPARAEPGANSSPGNLAAAGVQPGGAAKKPAAPPLAMGVRTAADFPNGASLRNLYGVSLLIHGAATPKTTGGSTYWPSWAAEGSWPVALAWTAGLMELVGGLCLALGLFTRVSGAAIVGVMLVAMWLTELGPAAQAGKTMFIILPDRGPETFFDAALWKNWLLQACLIVMGITVMLLGPGPLSLDHGVFTGEAGGDEPSQDKPKSGRPI